MHLNFEITRSISWRSCFVQFNFNQKNTKFWSIRKDVTLMIWFWQLNLEMWLTFDVSWLILFENSPASNTTMHDDIIYHDDGNVELITRGRLLRGNGHDRILSLYEDRLPRFLEIIWTFSKDDLIYFQLRDLSHDRLDGIFFQLRVSVRGRHDDIEVVQWISFWFFILFYLMQTVRDNRYVPWFMILYVPASWKMFQMILQIQFF